MYETVIYDLPDGFIVGTAGAGDAFCSGALLAIERGLSDTELLEYAMLAAAASLRSADGTGAVKELSVLKEELKDLKRGELPKNII